MGAESYRRLGVSGFLWVGVGVQGYRHEANGVFGHDTSSALAMGFTVRVSIIESRAQTWPPTV